MAAQSSQAPLAPKRPDGRCARGPEMRSAKTCPGHRVRPVGQIRLHCGEGGVGEEGVVAPAREQLTLPGVGLGIELADPADHQPGVELVAGAGEGGVDGFGDLGVGDPLPGFVVPHRVRVADRGPGVLADQRDRGPRPTVSGDGDARTGPRPGVPRTPRRRCSRPSRRAAPRAPPRPPAGRSRGPRRPGLPHPARNPRTPRAAARRRSPARPVGWTGSRPAARARAAARRTRRP